MPMTYRCRCRTSGRLAASSAALLLALLGCANAMPASTAIDGIVWQPDHATLHPRGNWDKIGARELLIQWTQVDQTAFVAGAGVNHTGLANSDASEASEALNTTALPDWQRIAAEPWARDVILGLAGSFSESAARAGVERLALQSQHLATLPTPLHVTGWYFPVEVDPSWQDAKRLTTLLAALPRPLWISAYDSANIGPDNFTAALAAWLPDDIGVLFQDGVGVHARAPHVARRYADALAARFGQARVRIIIEAFRPHTGGGFRNATVDELAPQLGAYNGYRTYLFDGPHYVDAALVDAILKQRPTALEAD